VAVIKLPTNDNQNTKTGITPDTVKELLTAMFKTVPLNWMKHQKKPLRKESQSAIAGTLAK
jgi:hypothetical protein